MGGRTRTAAGIEESMARKTGTGTEEIMPGRMITAVGTARDNGWQGNNPVIAGNNPGDNGYNHGWQGNGNSGWQGHNPGSEHHRRLYPGQGTSDSGWQGHNPWQRTTTGGTTTGGTTTAGYTPGQGTSGSGWQGHNSGGGGPRPAAPVADHYWRNSGPRHQRLWLAGT